MKCTKFLEVNTLYGERVKVPCGYCRHCRIDKKREWQVRLIEERKSAKHGAFVTLTYSQETVVWEKGKMVLVKKHLQDFNKRLRRNIEKHKLPWDYRYYAVGEYGEKSGRPHYHILMFNIPIHGIEQKIARQLVEKAWSYYDRKTKERISIGRIDYGEETGVTPDSIAYCLGYVMKKQLKENREGQTRFERSQSKHGLKESKSIQVEFTCQSKGIGKEYLTESIKRFHKQPQNSYMINHRGSKVKLPRYYEERLFDTEEEYYAYKLDKYNYQKENKPNNWRTRLEILEQMARDTGEYITLENGKRVYNTRGLTAKEKEELNNLRKRYILSVQWSDKAVEKDHKNDKL